MRTNYTQAAKERCLDLIDADVDAIWENINRIPADTDSDKWKKKMLAIADEYTFSSRFALMRILQQQLLGKEQVTENSEQDFNVIFDDGSSFTFSDISIEHAKNMLADEMEQYEKLLMDKASKQSDADNSTDLRLIQKALRLGNKKTTILSREEAFQLGHMLRFSLEEMEWFLLRVFNIDGGFRYNASDDLIEAYGFLTEESYKAVAHLKRMYYDLYGKVQKVSCDEKEAGFTQDSGNSLPEKVNTWTSDDRDNQFLAWLGTKASQLDLPSLTALRIYRDLAVFTYNLANDIEDTPNVQVTRISGGSYETDFVRCIREIVTSNEYADQTTIALFENGVVSENMCKKVASSLLVENLNFSFSDQTDKSKSFHVIDMLTSGKMTVSGGVNASRTRVQDILSGKEIRIEKSDMLYLLWFTANLCWFQGNSNPCLDEIATRLFDFIDVAENCLNAAGLPGFYPPHLIEQSMLLSIIYAYAGPEKCEPAEVYETICSSLIEHRAKAKKALI